MQGAQAKYFSLYIILNFVATERKLINIFLKKMKNKWILLNFCIVLIYRKIEDGILRFPFPYI